VKTAVITGVAGQDGSYLLEFLLKNNYRVVGIARRNSTSSSYKNISHVKNKDFVFIQGDLSDPTCISRVLTDYRPHEFYNLGAQSHVGYSFENPVDTFRTNSESVVMHLDMIKNISPDTRYYQAGTSEIMGGKNCPLEGYCEVFFPNPRSPYAVSKAASYYAVKNFRESYGLYAVTGILFNHSSPRRGFDFATRKITSGLAKIKVGLQSKIKMGDLSAFRDEGFSGDYVAAMWMMLNQDYIANKKPEDYIVSTGSGATIEEMFRYVCSVAGINFDDVYEIDEKYIRPSEVPYLLGDSSKIKKDLGWYPEYSWQKLLFDMYNYDLERINYADFANWS